jgi:ubiquinone/menaquinone biosynthesis C-methylase UbiE
MGRLRPVPAVTSNFESIEECLASGQTVVALLDQLGAVHEQGITLHIGSGLGRVEYHLRQRVLKCYGVDISSSMVRQARTLVPFDNVEFIETDGTDLSRWGDGYFDLIYSFLVFQHLPRPQFAHYVLDAYSKLSVGGRFVFQLLIDETNGSAEPPPTHPYGLRYYNRSEVEERLRAAGFNTVERSDLRGRPDDGTVAMADVVFCATKSK